MQYLIAVDYPLGRFSLRRDVLEELFGVSRRFFFGARFKKDSFWESIEFDGTMYDDGKWLYPLNVTDLKVRCDRRLLEIAAREGVENLGVGRTKLKLVDVPDDVVKGRGVELCKPDVGGEYIAELRRIWE